MIDPMNVRQDWQIVAEIPAAGGYDAVVWRFDPIDFWPYVSSLETFLSADEIKRLDRFLNQESRLNFIVCRGVLHFLLSCAAGCPLEQITIENDPQGKPQLSKDAHSHTVFFNISHTQNLCLIALSHTYEVGIDVERLHPLKELSSLAQTYLSPEEWEIWQKKGKNEKLPVFYEFWCAKEAILKAAGCGLTIHPRQVNTIEAQSGCPVRGIQDDGCFFEFRDYALYPMPLGSDYRGWLVAFGKACSLGLYEFSPQLLTNSFSSFSEGINVEK